MTVGRLDQLCLSQTPVTRVCDIACNQKAFEAVEKVFQSFLEKSALDKCYQEVKAGMSFETFMNAHDDLQACDYLETDAGREKYILQVIQHINRCIPAVLLNEKMPFKPVEMNWMMQCAKQAYESESDALSYAVACGNYDLYDRLMRHPQVIRRIKGTYGNFLSGVLIKSIKRGYVNIALKYINYIQSSRKVDQDSVHSDIALREVFEGLSEAVLYNQAAIVVALLNDPYLLTMSPYVLERLGDLIYKTFAYDNPEMLGVVLGHPIMKEVEKRSDQTVLHEAFWHAAIKEKPEKLELILRHPCAKTIPTVPTVGKKSIGAYIWGLLKLFANGEGTEKKQKCLDVLMQFVKSHKLFLLGYWLFRAAGENNLAYVQRILRSPESARIPLERGKYSLQQITQTSEGDVLEILSKELERRRNQAQIELYLNPTLELNLGQLLKKAARENNVGLVDQIFEDPRSYRIPIKGEDSLTEAEDAAFYSSGSGELASSFGQGQIETMIRGEKMRRQREAI